MTRSPELERILLHFRLMCEDIERYDEQDVVVEGAHVRVGVSRAIREERVRKKMKELGYE
jgi:hypothetical protein